jgi:Flp pilus assembly protein TadB
LVDRRTVDRMRRRRPDPMRITSASRPRSEDIRGRERRYLISMAVRTACVVLAVVFMGSWLMWVFLVGAVFLPYVAVVVANVSNPDPGGPEGYRPDLRALGTGGADRPLEP